MQPPEAFGYRFKLPELHPRWATTSFGIEPFRVNLKGTVVKAGKAVVRIVMYRTVANVNQDAEELAKEICWYLNTGREYIGPKVLHLDTVSKYPKSSVLRLINPFPQNHADQKRA